MKTRLLSLLFLSTLAALGQFAVTPTYVYVDPSGPCTNQNEPHRWSLGSFTDWYCNGTPGTWTQVKGGISNTPTDDNVLVGNGSAWQNKALPACADSAGNHLNYDASANTFSCGTSASTPAYTFVDYRVFQGAVCQSTTAASPFSLAAANAGVPGCATGTNTNTGTLHFLAGSASYAQQHVPLPKTWSGNVDAAITWRATATSGNVVWGLKTVAVPAGMTMDQTLGTGSSVTTAAPASTLVLKADTITALSIANAAVGTAAARPGTCTAGAVYLASDTNAWSACLATDTWSAATGVELFFAFYRLGTGADTMTGDAELFELQLKLGSSGPVAY